MDIVVPAFLFGVLVALRFGVAELGPEDKDAKIFGNVDIFNTINGKDLCDSTVNNLFILEKGVRKKLNFPGGEPKSKKTVFLYSPMTKAANDTIDNFDKTLQEFYRQLCNKSDVDNYSVGKSFMKNPYQ